MRADPVHGAWRAFKSRSDEMSDQESDHDQVHARSCWCVLMTPGRPEGAASVTCTTSSNSRAVCSTGYARTDNSATFSADTCTAIASNCATDYNGGGTAFPSASCTSAGMFIKASLPTSSCASSTCIASECCDPCDTVENARSISCTAAGNTVPKCKSGYFCAGGSTCNAGDTCTACSAVDNAVSVTCSATSNSRATCRTGCTKTDNSATASSDVCSLPPRNCATNWVRLRMQRDPCADLLWFQLTIDLSVCLRACAEWIGRHLCRFSNRH
jgi:hypothetical protein